MSTQLEDRTVTTWNGEVTLRLRVGGSGPALIYLHPSAGLAWDPFLDLLAQQYTVYAPEFPGTTPGDPYAIHKIDSMWDAVLIYEQAFRELDLQGAVLVGQSFGGMLAAELAAAYPVFFSKVVLLDPVGLWDDAYPVANWISAPPQALPGLLFADPEGPAALAMLAMPSDPEAAASAQAQLVWNLGATGKLCWPIPDRGLKHRLHRILAPTLVVWGEKDALVSVAYAEKFAAGVADGRTAIIAGAGHIPQVEATAETWAAVQPFLAD